ncbi:YuzL family protein [Robertmurraya kyonggiensis]|uniref:YuzL family protein n=1 Tax=Robertmurraya kyonggiensis TaxID=1037680 RepID=A0A4V5P0Q1_9BACI|nr:YuzL family protein [Robertmurraya kyonggiensis]TKC15390.1 YuzL family protein [Robertmurraya kyonggiensis]
MGKKQKDPSKAGVSAASVEGNAGPGAEKAHKDKKNSQNNQFKR